jgi:DNA helicase INO80
MANAFDSIGAEDAAQEFEDSMMGPSPGQLMGADALYNSRKRAMSDASSDADLPLTTAMKGKEPANKKRKVGETLDAVPIRNVPLKGKAKAKQVRETSLDSVSTGAALKPARKRPARKKQDALPPQTQELLGIGSSASAAGDMTPSSSRPASPALTTASDRMGATVFELDEDVPPLKKARKVDDATMLKRVRALEETQKKVWTTIARRDIPRVSSQPCYLVEYIDGRLGLQIPSGWLSVEAGSTEAHRNFDICTS